jgi:hypothetical protein
MADYFYHPSAIDILYPSSSYLLEGQIYVTSGTGEFQLSMLTYDASSVLNTKDFIGDQNKWTNFSHTFSVAAITSGPILKIEYMGKIVSLAYFDEIGLGVDRSWGALGVLRIYPEWEMKRFTKQNRNEHRTKGGKLYSYTWGDYDRFEIPVEYVSNSKASIINSWWSTDALIYFKIYSGGVWEVNTCHLMNESAPLPSFQRPYTNYRKGTLTLETF